MAYTNTSILTANLSGLLDGSDTGGNIYRPFSVFSVLTLTLLAMLVVATFVWNLLVLVTILRVRTFHRVPHNLVASMAISDVMVAGLVMPLSLVHELNGRSWKLGRVLCQVWISFDVLCCTASIWNVTAIALDRYWSITRHLQYTLKTRKKISNVMIALTWLLSSIISLSPLFGWGETYSEGMKCQVSQEPSYTIFSTFGAFYLPLCVVLFVYWKIYKAAKFRIGSRKTNTITPMAEVIHLFFFLTTQSLGMSSHLRRSPCCYFSFCQRIVNQYLPMISESTGNMSVLKVFCFPIISRVLLSHQPSPFSRNCFCFVRKPFSQGKEWVVMKSRKP